MFKWMPEQDRATTFFLTFLVSAFVVVILGFTTCATMVELEKAQYTPPPCPEDATIAYNGECITVDDADFRNGYWYPKR